MNQKQIIRWMTGQADLCCNTLYKVKGHDYWLLGRKKFIIKPFVAKRLIKKHNLKPKSLKECPYICYDYPIDKILSMRKYRNI